MEGRVSCPTVVGRQDELDALSNAFEEARAGRGSFVIIEGEAGIGKSRLVREFEKVATRQGATVLSGACFPFTGAVPYAPLAGLLSQLEVDPARVARRAGDIDQGLFFQYIAEALGSRSQSDPVVLTVEDLHWADTGTGDFLLFMAHAVTRRALLLLGTRRTDESARSTGLIQALGELTRSGGAGRIVLRPLGEDEIAEVALGILRRPPRPDLVTRITERAEGNPFFTEELIAVGDDGGLPVNVREAILARTSRIDENAQATLRTIAAAGRRVDHRLLVELAGESNDLEVSLRDAVSNHLLVVDGESYAFRHALVQEVLYGELLPGERSALHQRIAETISERPELSVSGRASASAELAHHWHAAGRLPEALSESIAAGALASERWAPAEALAHYRRALAIWPEVAEPDLPPGVELDGLRERAATAAFDAGFASEAATLTRATLAGLGRDDERAVDTLSRLSTYLWMAGAVDESRAVDDELARCLPATRSVARARGLAALGSRAMVDARLLDAIPQLAEAAAIAGELGATDEHQSALRALGSCKGALGCHDDAIASIRAALEVGASSHEIAWGWGELAAQHIIAGRHHDAVLAAERGLEETRRRGLRRTHEPALIAILAIALTGTGNWNKVERLTDAALTDDAEPLWAAQLQFARSAVAMRRGRFDEATQLLDDVAESLNDREAPDRLASVAELRSELELMQERFDAARRAVRRGLEIAFGTDDVGPVLRLTALHARIEAEAATAMPLSQRGAEVDAVRRSVDDAIAAATAELDRIETAMGIRSDAFHLLIDFARAERSRLDDSVDVQGWASFASRPGLDVHMQAYALYRHADALLASPRERNQARTPLAAARQLAESLEARPLLSAIDDLASRARFDLTFSPAEAAPEPPALSPADELGLTARELEVLRLVAQGWSNGDIAAALYINRKTVSVHVSHILQKLGVSSRVQAAARAHRLGLGVETSPIP